jgi:hypothetical protein
MPLYEQLLLTDKTNVKGYGGKDTKQGLIDTQSELTLDMDDEELIGIKNDWLKKWDKYSKKIIKKQKRCEKFWLGLPKKSDDNDEDEQKEERDNLIFEALETFIPIATAERPEPVVYAAGKEIAGELKDQGEKLAKDMRQMLAFKADTMHLKIMAKKVVRNWSIDLLGVVKHGWSEKENDFKSTVIRATDCIFDPMGTIDSMGEYTGQYIGEYKKDQASTLALRFPKKASDIKQAVEGKMGSEMRYIEWWTPEYVFWTMNEVVLEKAKNPHWNEDKPQEQMDEFGKVTQTVVKAKNHFKNKKVPYSFLSVFNLGKHPHDDTSLILQNVPQQEAINKRNEQIEDNVQYMNGAWVVSGEMTGLNQEEATQAVRTAMRGGGLYVPQGNPQTAVVHTSIPSLPADVYSHREDMRNELRNIFGTRGSTAQSIMKERTVRGKSQIAQLDASRIGNGIGEHVEQFVDHMYNWWVQLMYVYYDQPHSASVLGQDRATEYITLKNDQMTSDLLVTVKEGSLMPKDQVSKADQMKELATAGLIDPISLFDALDFPNPKETAKRLWLWTNAPQELFKDDQEVQAVLQQQQQAALQEQQQKQQDGQTKHNQSIEKELIKQNNQPNNAQ